ncbi:MAG: outer membrane lipoprotein carrier protein LolA [Spirochaetaceae bacterium]|jgi:hypothetical protein|nr:outer membrane lipoprotein carrier protein LolA [Spirochaetaceae bacterium]
MKCFYLLFFVFLCGVLAAEENNSVFSHPLRDTGNNRFLEICDSISAHKISAGNFVQEKTIKKLNRKLVSSGAFVIYAPLGIIWKTEAPFSSITAAGKDFIVQQSSQGKKQKLSAAGNEAFIKISDTINAVFSGEAGKLFNNFKVYFFEKDGEWTMGLEPLDRTVRGAIANIVISGGSNIRRITLSEQNGDSIQYELFNYAFPQELSENERAFFFVE